MAETPRYLAAQVLSDLERKMAFVAGPRQVGKTTLARSLPGTADTCLTGTSPRTGNFSLTQTF